MTRKIRYKEVSDEYNKIVAPNLTEKSRYGAGLEKSLGEYYYIKTDDLIPYKNQARKVFDEEELIGLRDSIKLYGVRQPLTILPADNNKYEIISGERRLRAAKMAGLAKVPCIILDKSLNSDAVALVENLHRSDLHPVELMKIYKELLEKKLFSSLSELASKIGIQLSTISETISLSDLPDQTLNDLLQKNIKSRALQRALLKSPVSQHQRLIKEYEDGKKKRNVSSKKLTDQKIKVLNIVSQDNYLIIENNRLSNLSLEQKEKIKHMLLDLLESIG